MDKIDWKRKLSSRKFWIAIAAFVAGLIIYITKDQNEAAEISGIIMSGGAVIAYIVAEGWADGQNIESK